MNVSFFLHYGKFREFHFHLKHYKKVLSHIRILKMKNVITSIGFDKGMASENFPIGDITTSGLVRTNSIHKKYKIIGIN
jgi:hypothetical protein